MTQYNATMNPNRQTDIAAACGSFVQQTGLAIDWINDPRSADKAADQRQVLERRFRRSIRRAGKLQLAAKSNMAVSVFGPSQNGKSFLVSVLARPQGKDLVTAFDDPSGALSYIGSINPPGEGESTGLVTRFTMTRPKTPVGFPVALSMMSVADLVQTIANSFFMDGDQREPPIEPAQLSAHLENYANRAGQPSGALTEDSIWEIADYIERNFVSSAYARELRSFWDEAASLAPRLAMRDLGPFLSIIWGGYDEFTAIFVTLSEGLERIGHASHAFAPMAALIPRETSIIDVAQLRRIDTGQPDLLTLQLPDGREAQVDRAVLCALTAEFVLPMRDLPDPMFQQTDLLDFPGTRNRFSQPLSRTFTDSNTGGIGQLLLRGKVAYLFDRYVEDQKINAMLLCIKDSNMESIDLPPLIENWVALTQGATPEQRRTADCILFLLLTFFDKHLIDSAAASGETERFEKRLYQSIGEKFGPSDWVQNWTPGRKFQNTFWIRNPNFPVEAVFDYDDATDPPSETLRPEKAARMAELKAGHQLAPRVRDHFADPSAAWDAAMTPNDGGVGYLRSHLAPVCNIGRKLDQIDAQLRLLEQDVVEALERMHVSDDLDTRIAEKQEAANRVIDGLEHALENRSFAELMGALMVDQDQLFDRMSRVPMNIRISNAVRAAAPVRTDAGDGMPRPGSAMRPGRPLRPGGTTPAAPTPAAVPEGDNIRTMSRASFQAETALRIWAETLDRLKDDPRLRQHFGLTTEAAVSLTAEMLHAGRRGHLEQKIRDRFEASGYGLRLEGQARPASVIAAEAINRFVAGLGTLDLPEADRPRAGEDNTAPPVFAARPVIDDVTDLPDDPCPTLEDAWRDWVYALYAMYRANAMHLSGTSVDPEMNSRLGAILRQLRREGARE